MSVVAVIKHKDDHLASVTAALAACGAEDLVSKGMRALVKPNLHGGDGTTSPEMMEAACRWAFERGAAEVLLGDGPFWGMKDHDGYFRRKGVFQAAEHTGARVVVLDHEPFRLFRPCSPHLPQEIGITELAFACDMVINLPLMKTHFNTLVTLGMKNLKGCIRPQDKRAFHEMELNRALVELNRLFKPHVTLMDAVTAFEGRGPSAATPVDLGLALASRDVVRLDAVACFLMGIEPGEVRMLKLAAETGLGEIRMGRIQTVGESPQAHQRRFERPFDALRKRHPTLQVLNDGSCSGCDMNFFSALQQCEKAQKPLRVSAVVLGRATPPSSDALLIGHCTRPHWPGRQHVPGCPPREAEIAKSLASES